MLINNFQVVGGTGLYQCLLHSSMASKWFVKSLSILTGMFLLKDSIYDQQF